MAEDPATTADVRVCMECGWPALARARRCPYCRATLPRSLPRLGAWAGRLDPLIIAFGVWVVSSTLVAFAALALAGPSWAGLVFLPLIAPFAALFLLRQRTVARIRAIGRPRRGAGQSGRRIADRRDAERRASDAGHH